ncbi:MAG: PGF-pre-PGF domain-containing protein [Candidatus Woesearchaeota archaeon]|nr:MAG: PGF-pre-PGF domain-containing protein [Candidatus Woesearchaeota archaeon]
MKLNKIAKGLIFIICFSFLFTCVSAAFSFNVEKNANGGEFNINETVIYTINISNNGPANITQLEINDTYNSTHLNYSTSNINPNSTGTGWVFWNLTNSTNGIPIAPGSWFSFSVNMTTLAFGNNVMNNASINATDNESMTNVSYGEVPINITKQIDFNLLKFARSYDVPIGKIIGYGINITNIGDTNLTVINLTDTFNNTIMEYSNSNMPSNSNGTNGDITWFTWLNVNNETGPISPGETRTVLLLNMTALAKTNNANNSIDANVSDDLNNKMDAYNSIGISITAEDWDDGLSDWESYIASPYILKNQEKNLTFYIRRQAGDDSCLNNITILLPSTNFTYGGYNSTTAINYTFTFNASGNGNDFVWTNSSSGFFCGRGPKNFTLEINSTDAFKSANFEITAVSNGTSSSSINLTMYTTTTFSFNGSVRGTDGNVLENATASMTVASFGPNGDVNLGTFSTLSDSNGKFNITGIPGLNASQGPPGSDMLFYMLSVVKYNDSNQQYAMAVGPSLPDLPEMELLASWGLANPEVYLKPAVTFYVRSQGRDYESGPNDTSQCDENGCNDTAFNFTFLGYNYGLKDRKLGFPVSYDHGASRPLERYIAAPLARNYSLMVFPSSSFPIYVNFNNINATCNSAGDNFSTTGVDAPCSIQNGTYFINVTINATMNITPFTGSVNVTNLDALKVVPYMLGGGEMIFDQDTLPFDMGQMMRWPKNNSNYSDFYNLTSGNFTVFLPATEAPSDLMLMAFATKGDNYYLDYYKLNSSRKKFEVSNYNFNLSKLINGTSKVISSENISNDWEDTNIVNTTAIQFNLVNGSGSLLDGENSFIEMKVDINSEEYRRMTDAQNGVFTLPMIKGDSIKDLTIFSQSYAPVSTYVSASVLDGSSSTDTINCSAGVCNITMTGFDELLDPNGSVLDLVVDFYISSSTCDVPNPNASCEIITGINMSSEFSPFQAILRGDLSLRMSMNNLSVHYVDTDLLASGPPDASFSQNASESGLEAAWKFGSKGPEIYDYVLISIPYNASAIVGNITVEIPELYDNEYNCIWNSSDGDNTTNISNNDELASFRDYLNNSYESYLNGTGVLCNESDSTLSAGLCYEDNVSDIIWMKIPHFSGIGPKVIGSGISPGPVNFTIEKISPDSTYYINWDTIVNYVINITNYHTSNITSVSLNDTFDETYINFSNADIAPTSNGTGWVYWDDITGGAEIENGSIFQFYINMTAQSLGSSVQNNASVNATNGTISSTADASVSVDIHENTTPNLVMLNVSGTTNDPTPNIHFNYSDSYSNATCTLYFDNISHGTESNVDNGTHNITASTVWHGNYSVYVGCIDNYNNTNQSSAIEVQVQYDMDVNLTSPTNDTYIGGADRNQSTFNLTYSVNIPAECNITIWGNDGNITAIKRSNATNGNNRASFGIANGNYQWNVNCSDLLDSSNYALGNLSNWTFTVDDEEVPDINISSPEDGHEYSASTDEVTLTVVTENENATCYYDDDTTNIDKPFNINKSVKYHTISTDLSIDPGEDVTYYVQCWDAAGNNANDSVDFSIRDISDDDSGGASSAGGGTGTTSTTGASQTHVWNVIEGGATATMTISKEAIGLEKIEFTASTTINNVELKVTKLSDKSEASENAPGSVFQYINMESTNIATSSLTSIYMHLKVNKSWITSNNINENTVSLYRWESNKWNKLVTVLTQKGTDNYYYRAVVPGFSEFAIAGESSGSISPTTTEVNDTPENITIETVDINADGDDEELIAIKEYDETGGFLSNWKFIVSIIVLIAVIVVVGVHFYFKVYKTGIDLTGPKDKKADSGKKSFNLSSIKDTFKYILKKKEKV